MTTKITVDAHAGWPVKVTVLDRTSDGTQTENIVTVPPHTVQDFYVHSHRDLRIQEVQPG